MPKHTTLWYKALKASICEFLVCIPTSTSGPVGANFSLANNQVFNYTLQDARFISSILMDFPGRNAQKKQRNVR